MLPKAITKDPVMSKNKENIKHRDYVLTGRERHTHARPDNLGLSLIHI